MTLATHALCAIFAYLAATVPVPAPAPEEVPWQLLHQHMGGEVDAAVVVRDLRRLDGDLQRFAGVVSQIEAGRAFFGRPAKGSKQVTSDDTPLQTWLSYAAPSGRPVPAAVLLVSTPVGVDARLAVRVEPGFVERCRDKTIGAFQVLVRSSAQTPPASALLDFIAQGGGASYVGRVTNEGYLLLASDATFLGDAGAAAAVDQAAPAESPQQEVSQAMRNALRDSEAVLWLKGGGPTFGKLAAQLGAGMGRASLQQIQSAALALQTDGDKTAVVRLLLEAPWAQTLATSFGAGASEGGGDPWFDKLDANAVGYASVQSSPLLRAAIPALLVQGLGRASLQIPDDVLALFTHLSGRVGVMSFADPGDWAVALPLDSAQSAENLLPVLQGFTTTLAQRMTPGASSAFQLEPFAGLPHAVLHLRPDPALEGPYVAALDRTLWLVAQRSRLSRLVAQQANHAPAPTAPKLFVEGPLTPLMRSTVQPAHLLQSYTVLSGDAGWLDYAVWGAGKLQGGMAMSSEAPSLPLGVALGAALPKLLASASYVWMHTYDVAFTADIHDGMVELSSAASGI